MARNKEYLTEKLNEVFPLFISAAESYFEEPFMESFSDKKIYADSIPAAASVDMDHNVVLCYFDGIGFSNKNFKNKRITGYGIFNIFHELTHLYQIHNKYDHFLEDKKDFRYELKEAHCEISSRDIINQTFLSFLFPNAVRYAKKNDKEHFEITKVFENFLVKNNFDFDDSNPKIFRDLTEELFPSSRIYYDKKAFGTSLVYKLLDGFKSKEKIKDFLNNVPKDLDYSTIVNLIQK